MKLEIVNHTHNYSRLLAWQLSSLVAYPTEHEVTYTVFYDPTDAPTRKVLDYYWLQMPLNVKINAKHMPVQFLRNRANGRNAAAKDTKADWIWFTDTDYVFGATALDQIGCEALKAQSSLLWPANIQETDWPTGDALINRVDIDQLKIFILPTDPFSVKRMNRAIGGVQIAHGPTAKKIGYCPEMAGRASDHWNFRSDIRFRRCFDKKDKIDVSNIIRIRHTNKGYGQPNCLKVVN